MSFTQRFILALLPKSWRPEIIAHSQAWKMICRCGSERSIWELGGIRWRAVGNSRHYMRCPKCGERSWQRLEKREPVTPPKGAG